MERSRRDADDAHPQTRMHKGLIEVRPFVRGHPAIFSCFAVEDEVRGKDGGANDTGAVEETLGQVASLGASDGRRRLDVCPVEGISGFGKSCYR